MDERVKELIAIGASAAANCHSCIDHHLAECDRLGLSRDEIKAAIEIGMTVSRGAAARTRTHGEAVLASETIATGAPGGRGCNC